MYTKKGDLYFVASPSQRHESKGFLPLSVLSQGFLKEIE